MSLFSRKKFIKIGKIITVFVVILAWIFFGWPQMNNFPPKIDTVKAVVPQNGRASFVAAWDPDIYWVLDSTDLGTNYGDSVAGGDDNTAVTAGDISTQAGYEGMHNVNDDGANSDFDIHLQNDSAWLMYIPAGMTHGRVYGLWSNGGNVNAQGAFARATTIGVEIACSHNNGSGVMDTVIYEIPDAQLDDWFMIGCQFNSHGGSEGDMAIWIDGVAEGSGTRVNTLDYGSGDPDFGNNTGNEPDQSDVIYPVNYSGGDWTANNAITGSGILIANFTVDNPSGGASDTSPGNGDNFYTDYYNAHHKVGISISLNTDGLIALGTVPLNTSQDTTLAGINDVEIISVDAGPTALDIKSTVFTEGGNTWTLNTSNGPNQVHWEFSPDGSAWTTFAAADTLYSLATNVAQSGTQDTYLRITMPTATDSYSQYSATVTIVASAP